MMEAGRNGRLLGDRYAHVIVKVYNNHAKGNEHNSEWCYNLVGNDNINICEDACAYSIL